MNQIAYIALLTGIITLNTINTAAAASRMPERRSAQTKTIFSLFTIPEEPDAARIFQIPQAKVSDSPTADSSSVTPSVSGGTTTAACGAGAGEIRRSEDLIVHDKSSDPLKRIPGFDTLLLNIPLRPETSSEDPFELRTDCNYQYNSPRWGTLNPKLVALLNIIH